MPKTLLKKHGLKSKKTGNPMTHEESQRQIQNGQAMIAHANGKAIECREIGYKDWMRMSTEPNWSFDEVEYRPAPAIVTRPWSSLKDMPRGPLWISHKNNGMGGSMVVAFNETTIFTISMSYDWDRLVGMFYSTDGLNFQPCEVRE